MRLGVVSEAVAAVCGGEGLDACWQSPCGRGLKVTTPALPLTLRWRLSHPLSLPPHRPCPTQAALARRVEQVAPASRGSADASLSAAIAEAEQLLAEVGAVL